MTAQKSNFLAYLSCQSGNEIQVFLGDDALGTLEHVQTTPATGRGPGLPGRGLPLTHSKDRRRLYASVYGDQDSREKDVIDTYAIDPVTGNLTHMASTPVIAQLSHISLDRSGDFLLGASEPSGLVVVYPIGDHGLVQQYPSFSQVSLPGAHQILTDYSNQCALVPSLSCDMVASFRFDEKSGILSQNSPHEVALPPGAGCRHVAFHPNRRFVYLLNQRDGSVVVYRLDASLGRLHVVMRCSALPPEFEGSPWAAQIKVSPNGNRLFASERRSNTLTAWSIDHQSGKISDRKTVGTLDNPRCFDVSPSGRYVVSAALGDNRVELFDVFDQSVAPRKVLELPAGIQPGWVEVL